MSVLAQALTTQPLLHILGFEGLTNRGPNTPALYLCNCRTINSPISLTENPIYRHLSQPDRTGLLVVQPHSQGSWARAAPVKELMSPVPAKCLVLGTSIPPSTCKRQSWMPLFGQGYPAVMSPFWEHKPGSALSFPPAHDTSEHLHNTSQRVLTPQSYLDSGRTLLVK